MLISAHFNLIAIVSAQACSVLICRVLSYYTIYDRNFKQSLKNVTARAKKEFIKLILPNAVKLGLTSIGGFCVLRFSVIMGSLYLPLHVIASYGITVQIIGIIAEIAGVYFNTYQPKIVQYWIHNEKKAIKYLYVKNLLLLLLTFIIGGNILLIFGNWILNIIDSKTPLCSISFIATTLLIYILEKNHGFAALILLTKNEVPFFKAALVAGGITFILLVIFLQ
jgi:O-antigen/teichoic acid export membrane protein